MVLTGRLMKSSTKSFSPKIARAHCDIPCGIYDPHLAQIAALTIVRMNQLIEELPNDGSAASAAKLGRYIATKEEHSELCKQELRILWGDYFKQEHIDKHPNLHEHFFKAMKLASSARQNNDMSSAQSLLEAVHEIAEIFWSTKGASSSRQPSRQGAAGGEIVYPS